MSSQIPLFTRGSKNYLEHIDQDVAKLSTTVNGSPQQTAQIDLYLQSRSRRANGRVEDILPHGQIYAPLSSYDEKEIRTLEILPGSFESPLSSRLHHCSLEFAYPESPDGPEPSTNQVTWRRRTAHGFSLDGKPLFYTALSYTWGPPVFDCPIECNGAVKQITRTLDSALRHLRHSTESIMLWVDQLCINQDDNAEKARQVPLMALVYQRALNTVIWLDDRPDGGAFTVLEAIHRNLGDLALDEQPASVFEDFVDRGYLPHGFDVRKTWEVLQGLFDRWWFTRTWIIQEALLSQTAFVRCGESKISWHDLGLYTGTAVDSGFYRWLQREVSHTIAGETPLIAFGAMVTRELDSQKDFLATQGAMRLSLLVALEDCRYAKCTEPRDKVYGVLGLCNDQIRPDYEKSLAQVYLETAIVWLESRPQIIGSHPQGQHAYLFHGKFRLLSCVDHSSDEGEASLPSWVPDWSRPRQTTSFGFSTSSLVAYKAGDWYQEGIFSISEDKRVLSSPGKVLGHIEDLDEVIVSPKLDTATAEGDATWFGKALGFIKRMYPYPTGEDVEEIFLQLCVAGKNETGKLRSPPDFRVQMRKLLMPRPILPSATNNSKGKKSKKAKHPKQQRQKHGETMQNLQLACSKALTNRRLCALSNGYLGLVPGEYVKRGDQIVVFAGAAVPFVIRAVSGGQFKLVGECYVHGIMQGEISSMGIDDVFISLI